MNLSQPGEGGTSYICIQGCAYGASYQAFTLFFDCAINVTSHISMRFYF